MRLLPSDLNLATTCVCRMVVGRTMSTRERVLFGPGLLCMATRGSWRKDAKLEDKSTRTNWVFSGT
jgi:hypothetical protein